MNSYRISDPHPCCPSWRSAPPHWTRLVVQSPSHSVRAVASRLSRVGRRRCTILASTVNGDYQPHVSQHQAHIHATALHSLQVADSGGPKYESVYEKAVEKAATAAERLTADEVKLLTNGLPRYYRHKDVPAEYIESAFDNGMLTLHELARTNTLDLNRAVKRIGLNGQLQKAMRLVEHLIKFQKANQHTLASFFQACLRTHRPNVALQTWEKWVPTGLMGPISASAVIACAAAYDANVAVKLLFRMEERKISMHKYAYHHVMTALASVGDVEQAVMIWNHMDAAMETLEPDLVTLQILLQCVCTQRQFVHTHELFSEMQDRNIIPDSQLAATFIKAFSWGGEVDAAEDLFRNRLQAWNITADVYHCNGLMYGHARHGNWPAVQSVLGHMLEEGIDPDEYTIVTLLTTVLRSRGNATGIETVQTIKNLKDKHGIQWNKYTCGAFIQALRKCSDAKASQRMSMAESLLEEAQDAGTQMNAFIMNSMIALYWEAFEYKKAKQQYDVMIDLEIFPTYYTCEVMTALCSEVGWLDEAEDFRKLKRSLRTTDEGNNP